MIKPSKGNRREIKHENKIKLVEDMQFFYTYISLLVEAQFFLQNIYNTHKWVYARNFSII